MARNKRRVLPVDTGMTTIGLIGSGNIGGAIARAATQAVYDVVLSNSRGPETLQELVAEIGPRARAATAAEAAEAGDLVVVTIPLKNYRRVPVEPLRGKTVIDTNNYYVERDGHIAELDDESTTVSELLQAHLPESHVVKAFNNIHAPWILTLARPAGHAERRALLVAADDAGARAEVDALVEAVGFDAYDAGPLADSWRFERDQPAYGTPYTAGPGDADAFREALAQATGSRA
jgi:predicted dinucleotide-binding enzyme